MKIILHEFRVGDWVRIVSPDPAYKDWFGVTGFVFTIQVNSTTKMIFVEVADSNAVKSVWLPSSLEYLGDEKMYVESILGADYFHG